MSTTQRELDIGKKEDRRNRKRRSSLFYASIFAFSILATQVH